jgi:hypothetical protein
MPGRMGRVVALLCWMAVAGAQSTKYSKGDLVPLFANKVQTPDLRPSRNLYSLHAEKPFVQSNLRAAFRIGVLLMFGCFWCRHDARARGEGTPHSSSRDQCVVPLLDNLAEILCETVVPPRPPADLVESCSLLASFGSRIQSRLRS